MTSTEERLRTFIVEELRYEGSPQSLTADYPLIDNQVVDSLGIYELVTFIEREFDVEILDEELVPDHFGTLGGIARLIDAKQGG